MITYVLLLLYQALLFAVGPFYLFWRFLQGKQISGVKERLALYAPELKTTLAGMDRPIWIHLVSVGEVLAAGPIITALRRIFPGKNWVVTTTTRTGRSVAERWIRKSK